MLLSSDTPTTQLETRFYIQTILDLSLHYYDNFQKKPQNIPLEDLLPNPHTRDIPGSGVQRTAPLLLAGLQHESPATALERHCGQDRAGAQQVWEE